MSSLARRFGVSDTALAKLCDRHQIPRPERGHWSKIAAGREIEAPPLPKLDDESFVHLPTRQVNKRLPVARSLIQRPRLEPSLLSAPNTLEPFLSAVREAHADPDGWITVSGPTSFSTNVSLRSVSRVLQLVNTLCAIAANEQLLLKPAAHGLSFWKGSQAISLAIRELGKNERRTPDNPERVSRQRSPTKVVSNTRNFTPLPAETSGVGGPLEISIVGTTPGNGLRRRFRDGEQQRIEAAQYQIVDAIIAWLSVLQARTDNEAASPELPPVANGDFGQEADSRTFRSVVRQLDDGLQLRSALMRYREAHRDKVFSPEVQAFLSRLEQSAEELIAATTPDRLEKLITDSYT